MDSELQNFLKKSGYVSSKNDKDKTVDNMEYYLYQERLDQNLRQTNIISDVDFKDIPYHKAYEKLRNWIQNSLDCFRDELLLFLFPIFVHFYLDLVERGLFDQSLSFFESFKSDHELQHLNEIQELGMVKNPLHLRENRFVFRFRNTKFNILVSGYCFRLLMMFLQEQSNPNAFRDGGLLTLKIINHYLNIRIYLSKTGKLSSTANGSFPPADLDVNSQNISWGVKLDPNFENVLSGNFNVSEELIKNNIKGPGKIDLIQQFKTFFSSCERFAPSSTLPHTELNKNDIDAEIQRLEQLMDPLSTRSPSIRCFTIHNSNNIISSQSTTRDASLIALGTSQSYIDVLKSDGGSLKHLKPSTELASFDLSKIVNHDTLYENNESFQRLVGHSGAVYGVRFFPSDYEKRLLLSSSRDKTAKIWSLDNWSNLITYKGHSGAIWNIDVPNSAICSPYFVTCSQDCTARLWMTECAHSVRILSGHYSDVIVAKFHPNCSYLATGSDDKTLRMFDLVSGNSVRLFSCFEKAVTKISFSIDGKYIFAGTRSSKVHIFDISSGKLLRQIFPQKSNSELLCMETSPNGRLLATGFADNSLILWDVNKMLSVASNDDDCIVAKFWTKNTPISHLSFGSNNLLNVFGNYQID